MDNEAGPSAIAPALDNEPLSTLREPLPLPPYDFDPALSEDENLLTWVSILARHSSSKKGHMGTILVRPPKHGDPSQAPSTQCVPPIDQRIIHYANNFPLLYSRLAKAVPEVHAEALAISRCARKGIAIEGCSIYISFPPCNDCFKLLLSAGVQRCVFKKGIPIANAQGEAALVAAEVEGMQLVGTLDEVMRFKAQGDEAGVAAARDRDRKRDEERDLRVRGFWAALGEDAVRTRARVARWWDDYMTRYRAAEKIVYGKHGAEIPPPVADPFISRKQAKREQKQESSARDATAGALDAANGAVEAAVDEQAALSRIETVNTAQNGLAPTGENDLDELRNAVSLPSVPAKRTSADIDLDR